jgi:hypothetical protein
MDCKYGEDSWQLLLFWVSICYIAVKGCTLIYLRQKLTTDPSGCSTLDFVGRAPSWGVTGYYPTLITGQQGSYRPQCKSS